jgi:hypothetical protein
MYQNMCLMMQSPCCYCMQYGMHMMYYPMMMPAAKKYEFEEEEEEKIKYKREDIEINEDMVRGNIQPQPIMKPVEQPIVPITQVQSEQNVITVLNKIEIEAPDIINKLITMGLTMEAARELIKKIIKITHKSS